MIVYLKPAFTKSVQNAFCISHNALFCKKKQLFCKQWVIFVVNLFWAMFVLNLQNKMIENQIISMKGIACLLFRVGS